LYNGLLILPAINPEPLFLGVLMQEKIIVSFFMYFHKVDAFKKGGGCLVIIDN